MSYALVNTSGNREYHETVLRFLDEVADRDVTAMALVALCDDGHQVNYYNSDELDLKRMAGILDLTAIRLMGGMDDDDED